MGRSTLALVALAFVVSAGAAGYWRGHASGSAAEVARQNAATLNTMDAQLAAHADLVKQSGDASRRLRVAVALREKANTQTSKDLRDALDSTADSRAGCTFPAGVMRQLAQARDAAAQAAASGVGGALPGAAASAAGNR